MNNPVYVGQPGKNCLHGGKSSHLSGISPALTWDLSWVGWIHSHINHLLLRSEIHYFAEISLRWDVSPKWDDFSHIDTSLFTSVQKWLLAASDIFHTLTHSIKFLHIPLSRIKEQMFEKGDSSNRQQKRIVAPFSRFYGKIWVGFCLNTGRRFFLEVSF